jgi:hypothetical protein
VEHNQDVEQYKFEVEYKGGVSLVSKEISSTIIVLLGIPLISAITRRKRKKK